MGNRYGRVLFLREYASYIKDSMVAELTDMNRNLMMSIDIVPVPTDEAVKEAENRLLGVETNITNWQRRQNANNNFSATVPYDMEQQKKEMKEFLDDLTTRDQRMMFAVIGILPTLPVCDIGFHTKQTVLCFLYCFISWNGNNINGHHQISVHIRKFRYHTVFDIGRIFTKKKDSSITVSHLEIVLFKFHCVASLQSTKIPVFSN